jgi:signal transduction histidine kinase
MSIADSRGRAHPITSPGTAVLEAQDAQAPAASGASASQDRLDRLGQRLRASGRLLAAEAVAQEQRRIAADVHDLVMQDLAFALAGARALAEDPAVGERVRSVLEAAERALAGAREVVGDLVDQDRRPVIETVWESASRAARQVPLSFEADGVAAGSEPDRQTLEALVHVAREAVTNAVKHSNPTRVRVVLDHPEEWHLKVRDDGCGFNVAAAAGGFGLESMRGHVRALGGRLSITSTPGSGTTVEVALP